MNEEAYRVWRSRNQIPVIEERGKDKENIENKVFKTLPITRLMDIVFSMPRRREDRMGISYILSLAVEILAVLKR